MECSKGMILEKQKDGSYLPFFVVVREEELIWSDDVLNTDLIPLLPEDGKYEIIHPGSTYRFTNDGWFLNIHSDTTCDISKSIPIQEYFDFIETDMELSAKIKLPIAFKKDNAFLCQMTMESGIHEFCSSNFSFFVNPGFVAEKLDITNKMIENKGFYVTESGIVESLLHGELKACQLRNYDLGDGDNETYIIVIKNKLNPGKQISGMSPYIVLGMNGDLNYKTFDNMDDEKKMYEVNIPAKNELNCIYITSYYPEEDGISVYRKQEMKDIVNEMTFNINNPIYRFHRKFKTLEKYKDSKIHITIHGNLFLKKV